MFTKPWGRMWEWRYSSIILNLSSKLRRAVSFTPLPLYLRETITLSIYGGLSGSQNIFVRYGEEEHLSHYRELNPDPVDVEPVALSLYWLSYAVSHLPWRRNLSRWDTKTYDQRFLLSFQSTKQLTQNIPYISHCKPHTCKTVANL
jgi:hypothetical protein